MKMNKADQEVLERAKLWLEKEFDADTREKVRKMIENNDSELVESFYKNLEFGTGGLRGLMGVGTNRMNIYTLGMATQGLCNYLKKQFPEKKQIKAVIAHDSRNNSRKFAETTANIFAGNNIKVYLFDSLRPTPELSFAIRHFGCQTGVVITASHNPKEYNGFKAYWEDGGQLIEPHDSNVIDEVLKIKSVNEVLFSGNKNLIEIIGSEIDELYTDKILTLSLNPNIIIKNKDLKIVYTPIHGTGVKLVPMILKKMGFTNIYNVPEQDVSDGNFPTVISPNPEESAALDLALKKAMKVDADLVMATDPDGDRVGVATKDQNGILRLLDGNQTATLLIYYLISQWSEKGRLTGKEYICKTIVTTDLLNVIADKFNVKHFDVLTGFKYIADILKTYENQLQFIGGGEESYGYLMGDFVRDKDAVMSCAFIAELTAWAKNKHMSLFDILIQIYQEFGFYKESLLNISKKGKEGAEEIQRMMDGYRNNPPTIISNSRVVMIHDYLLKKSFNKIQNTETDISLPTSNVLQFILEDGSKISIRPSGTEPKIKYYFSINTKLSNKEDFAKVENLLKDKISAIKDELKLT